MDFPRFRKEDDFLGGIKEVEVFTHSLLAATPWAEGAELASWCPREELIPRTMISRVFNELIK
jgi:hypothetical protein